MPTPILIFLERHWDPVPSDVVSALLKRIPEYNTLCVELPNDIPRNAIKLNYLKVVDSSQSAVKKVNKHFRNEPGASFISEKGNIESIPFPADIKSLAALSEISLKSLLAEVYDKREEAFDIANDIKFCAANFQKIENFDYMIEHQKNVIAIDIDFLQHNAMTSATRETIFAAADFYEDLRIGTFGNNLLALQDRGEASIFSVGEYHYAGLANWFFKKGRLQDVIFVRAYSPYTSFAAENDFSLLNKDLELPNLKLFEIAITNKQDISACVETLVAKIRPSQLRDKSLFATKKNYDEHNKNLALRQAASVADLDAVINLLSSEGINVNDAQVGLNPKTGKPFSGRTALHQAIIAFQKEIADSENFEKARQIIKILIENGADPYITDAEGKSCIDIAGGESITELLCPSNNFTVS